MTRAVWKYPLEVADRSQMHEMPEGARIVHVDTQQGDPCLWAEVEQAKFFSGEVEQRWFVVHGTGHDIDHDGTYVGSGMMLGGQFVWHVYEVTP